MPSSAPHTLLDRLEAEGVNVHPDLSGGVELLRDCLASNQHFVDISEDGGAEGYAFNPEATAPTGLHFYASEVNKNSLRKQSGVPEPLDSGFDLTEPFLPNGTLPVASANVAGNYRPPAPIVVSVSGGRAGYVAGGRELFITLVSRSGKHTLPSEGVAFSLTTGQGFRADVPEGIPKGLRIGWWLTEAGKGRGSAKLQKITNSGRAREVFAGPYRGLARGRSLPKENETEIPAPKKVRYGKEGTVYRGPGPGILPAGDYRFSVAEVTLYGVSRASVASDTVTVAPERTLEAPVRFYAATNVSPDTLRAGEPGTLLRHGYEVGDAVEVRGDSLPSPLVDGNTYFVVAIDTEDETAFKLSASPGGSPVSFTSGGDGRALKVVTLPYRRGESWRVRVPRPSSRDVIGWLFYVQYEGTWYKLYRKGRLGSADSHLGFRRDQKIRVDGEFSESEESGRTQSRAFAYAQENPPLENTSGVEPPGSAPEIASTFQASTSLAATGKRNYAYAEVTEDGRGGEKVSLPSRYVSHTTAPGEFARVIAPDPNNIFPNAEGREVGSDGIPLNASVVGADGTYDIVDGKHTLSTGGVSYGTTTKALDFDPQDVNTSLTYCFRGVIEGEIEAGSIEAVLFEVDSSGADISPVKILKSISSSGSIPFEVRVGPDGDIPWSGATVRVRMRVRMAGTTRRMTARAFDLAGHPYPMAPRKVRDNGPYEAATFSDSPAASFPRGVVWKIGPAPVTSYESAANEPLEEVDFTATQNPPSLPPAGWTHDVSLATSQIANVAGVRVWQVNDVTQAGSARASIFRDFTAIDGSSLALRHVFEAASLPGGVGNYLTYGRVSGFDGSGSKRLGEVSVYSDTGGLRLTAQNANNDLTHQFSGFRVSPGDVLDYEIIATGVGTVEGALTLLAATNGGERSVVAQIAGLDWRGLVARRVRAGGVAESNPITRWTLRTRRIVVTETGDAIGEAAQPPAGETVAPDRPPDGLGGYYAEDEDGETINQAYLFVPLYFEDHRFDVDNVVRYGVIPGETYTFGVRARHTVPAGMEGTLPWFLTVHSPAGESRDIGAPCGECAGIAPWSDEAITFTVPEGFTEVRAHFRNVGPGLYLSQDIALSLGAVVKRGYGVAGSGWFRAVLKGKTPYISPADPRFDAYWKQIGSAHEVPEGTSVSASYEHSADLLAWTPFSPDEGLPDDVHGAVRLDLAGDGRETPYVPAGSPYLSWFRPVATLCRETGESFTSGSVVGKDLTIPVSRPDYTSDTVGGHNLHTDTTDVIDRIREGFTVGFFTETDARLFAERCLEENWVLEVPMHGGTAEGRTYVLDIDEVVGAPKELTNGVLFDGMRNVRTTVEVSGAEVIEEY